MLKIILTKGLPASGKTTWAKKFMAERITDYGEKWKRINKDDLRAMLDDGQWSRQNEQFVLETRDFLVTTALIHGFNVIVDDTNLAPKHEIAMKDLAKLMSNNNKKVKVSSPINVKVEVKDFTDITPEECIKRDLKRSNSVGSKVIMQMYNQFLKPKVGKIDKDDNLSSALICDIDGTLAHAKNRGPYEWSKVGSDEPDFTIWEILLRYRNVQPDRQMDILLVSGRDEICRKETEKWLETFDIPYDHLWMRPNGDMRKDTIIKKEIYDNHIKGKYNVEFVLDDRNQVVELWRSLGLTCLQVADGDF